MNKSILQSTFTNTIMDIAESIASSDNKFLRDLYPGKVTLTNELNKGIAKRVANKQSVISDVIDDKVDTINKAINSSLKGDKAVVNKIKQEAANELDTKHITRKNIEDKLNNVLSSIDDSNLSKEDKEKISSLAKGAKEWIGYVPKANKKAIINRLEEINGGTDLENKLEYYTDGILTYFNNIDKEVNQHRLIAGMGAYEATAIITRHLKGGNATTDPYGRKNIAGIPFI